MNTALSSLRDLNFESGQLAAEKGITEELLDAMSDQGRLELLNALSYIAENNNPHTVIEGAARLEHNRVLQKNLKIVEDATAADIPQIVG
jgi:hypothetical protein